MLEGWAAAVRAGDPDRAARYFAVPAIVAQSMPVELQTREQVRKFNDELPWGAKLLEVQHDGRYVVGTFRLTQRVGRSCTTAGQLVRVAFVIRQRHFTEWRQVPDAPGAAPGPDEPEDSALGRRRCCLAASRCRARGQPGGRPGPRGSGAWPGSCSRAR